jgi:hypothetical protein
MMPGGMLMVFRRFFLMLRAFVLSRFVAAHVEDYAYA